MDSPAYLVPGIAHFTQLSPTSDSVITLGQTVKQPLIRPPSELSYRYEPHGLIYLSPRPGVADDDTVAASRGVPGVVQAGWVPGGGIPGTNPAVEIEAYLMNIKI